MLATLKFVTNSYVKVSNFLHCWHFPPKSAFQKCFLGRSRKADSTKIETKSNVVSPGGGISCFDKKRVSLQAGSIKLDRNVPQSTMQKS